MSFPKDYSVLNEAEQAAAHAERNNTTPMGSGYPDFMSITGRRKRVSFVRKMFIALSETVSGRKRRAKRMSRG